MAESIDNYSDIEDEQDNLTELFHKAANHIKTLASKLESPKLLELYSYYKQTLEGPCNTPRPRWYEMQAKAKWDAWNSLGNMPQFQAKQHYINLVSELDPDFDKNENNASWVSVSSFINTDNTIKDSEKTVFDHVKESDLTNLKLKLENNSQALKTTDDDGMGLIHWAADRGNINILNYLLDLKADINMLDSDGQTPLHYAVSCDHFDCIKLLVHGGADIHIKDGEGMLARDLTTDRKILQLLNN